MFKLNQQFLRMTMVNVFVYAFVNKDRWIFD